MTSTLQKRSITIAGRRTSLALEPPFWKALERWAKVEDRSLASLIAEIDALRRRRRPEASLAAAVRLSLLTRA
jgi:predicted DNA-binding ribbon-helix-helix protein